MTNTPWRDRINVFPETVILWGGTGQAKAVRPIIEHFGARVVAVFDDTLNLPAPFPDIELFHGWLGFDRWIKGRDLEKIGFCIAIGNPHGRVRLQLHDRLAGIGLTPATIAHPDASIAPNASIGAGSQVLAGAIIGAEARLGRQCIVNSNAIVEHEATLGDAVEIAPGGVVLGLTTIGMNSLVGSNATVLSRLIVGCDVVIGAGTVVSTHVKDGESVQGAASRPI